MKNTVKNIDIAAIVWADTHEVWEYVTRALADAAVETEGKARWLAQTGSDKAQSVMDAAGIIRLMVADMADAAGLQTSESNETPRNSNRINGTTQHDNPHYQSGIGSAASDW